MIQWILLLQSGSRLRGLARWAAWANVLALLVGVLSWLNPRTNVPALDPSEISTNQIGGVKTTQEPHFSLPTPVPVRVPRDTPQLSKGGVQAALHRAAAFEGGSNIPGNMGQACEAYADALNLVYQSLTSEEQDVLRTSESECSKGKSGELVITLKGIAQQFKPRTKVRQP
jgi:hypothetical protein